LRDSGAVGYEPAWKVSLCADHMGRAVRVVAPSALFNGTNGGRPMSQAFDASRSLTALEQDSTIIAVIEMSQSKWLVFGRKVRMPKRVRIALIWKAVTLAGGVGHDVSILLAVGRHFGW
jgi:hypothetical protein